MKITKYSVEETASSLTIIMPSPKDRKYKISPIIAISVLILLGLLTERAYFNGYFFGDTDLAILIRVLLSVLLIGLITIFVNQLICLYRGYEYLYIFKPTQHIEFYKKGNWIFGHQTLSLQEIVYWGVVNENNLNAFKEIGTDGRVGIRKKGGCLIFTRNLEYETEAYAEKDTEFGAGLTPAEAQLIAQKIGNFLGK